MKAGLRFAALVAATAAAISLAFDRPSAGAEVDISSVRKVLVSARDDLDRQLSGLSAQIDQAVFKLRDVAKLDPDATKEVMDQVFTGFKQQVAVILDKVGENSDLVDALRLARISAGRLLGWYKRQPASYPGRDSTIAQLETQIQRFDEIEKAVREQRNEAFRTLRYVAQQYSWFVQQQKVIQIVDALDVLDNVVNQMKELNQRLKDIASNIAPDIQPGASEQG